jgi:hypothetical protein
MDRFQECSQHDNEFTAVVRQQPVEVGHQHVGVWSQHPRVGQQPACVGGEAGQRRHQHSQLRPQQRKPGAPFPPLSIPWQEQVS